MSVVLVFVSFSLGVSVVLGRWMHQNIACCRVSLPSPVLPKNLQNTLFVVVVAAVVVDVDVAVVVPIKLKLPFDLC
jgi:hypothetical protein